MKVMREVPINTTGDFTQSQHILVCMVGMCREASPCNTVPPPLQCLCDTDLWRTSLSHTQRETQPWSLDSLHTYGLNILKEPSSFHALIKSLFTPRQTQRITLLQ